MQVDDEKLEVSFCNVDRLAKCADVRCRVHGAVLEIEELDKALCVIGMPPPALLTATDQPREESKDASPLLRSILRAVTRHGSVRLRPRVRRCSPRRTSGPRTRGGRSRRAQTLCEGVMLRERHCGGSFQVPVVLLEDRDALADVVHPGDGLEVGDGLVAVLGHDRARRLSAVESLRFAATFPRPLSRRPLAAAPTRGSSLSLGNGLQQAYNNGEGNV